MLHSGMLRQLWRLHHFLVLGEFIQGMHQPVFLWVPLPKETVRSFLFSVIIEGRKGDEFLVLLLFCFRNINYPQQHVISVQLHNSAYVFYPLFAIPSK